MVVIRVPPGRAGRLWLRGRLAAAERAADLLEQKAQVLRAEQRRRADAAEHSSREWIRTARVAREWTIRATLLAGERGLLLAAPSDRPTVEVSWTTLMGLRYPDRAECADVAGAASDVSGSAAHPQTRRAYRAALAAAVRQAADDAASQALTAELAATNRRVRALRRRRIPALREELTRIELDLEESDRAEASVRRFATSARRRS